MIAGRRSIYRCQAVEGSRLLELSAENLRTLISKDAELSDIFMKTFLARRLSMSSHGAPMCSCSARAIPRRRLLYENF